MIEVQREAGEAEHAQQQKRMLYDLDTAIKILKYLASLPNKEATVTDIVKGAHISYSTARAYIPWLAERGLVEVREEGKRKIVKITPRGIELLLAVARVYSILGIPFE